MKVFLIGNFILISAVAQIYCVNNHFHEELKLVDELWKRNGGRNITSLRERKRAINKCPTRRTIDGDRVTVDYTIYILWVNAYVEAARDFSVDIGGDKRSDLIEDCLHAEFFCRGEALLDMCYGEIRKIEVPLEIAVRYGDDVIDVDRYKQYFTLPGAKLGIAATFKKLFGKSPLPKKQPQEQGGEL